MHLIDSLRIWKSLSLGNQRLYRLHSSMFATVNQIIQVTFIQALRKSITCTVIKIYNQIMDFGHLSQQLNLDYLDLN